MFSFQITSETQENLTDCVIFTSGIVARLCHDKRYLHAHARNAYDELPVANRKTPSRTQSFTSPSLIRFGVKMSIRLRAMGSSSVHCQRVVVGSAHRLTDWIAKTLRHLYVCRGKLEFMANWMREMETFARYPLRRKPSTRAAHTPNTTWQLHYWCSLSFYNSIKGIFTRINLTACGIR